MDEKQKQAIKEIIKRMPSYLKLIYRLYRDKSVPASAKRILSLALGYNISPIDLIPGFIPVVGQIDNIYVTLILLRRALKNCPQDIANNHLEKCSITMDFIDKDIELSKQLMKDVGKTALNATGKALNVSANAVYKLGKKIVKPKDKDGM